MIFLLIVLAMLVALLGVALLYGGFFVAKTRWASTLCAVSGGLCLIGLALALASLQGSLSGMLNNEHKEEFRRCFWEETATCFEETATIPAALQLVRERFSEEHVARLQESLQPPHETIWSLYCVVGGGILWLGSCFCASRRMRNCLWVISMPLILIAGSNALYQREFKIYSRAAMRGAWNEEQAFWAELDREQAKILLTNAQIAAKMRLYFEQMPRVCHGEPYGALLQELIPVENLLPQ